MLCILDLSSLSMFMFFPYHLLGLADQLDLFANLQTFVLLLAISFYVFLQPSALFCLFLRLSGSLLAFACPSVTFHVFLLLLCAFLSIFPAPKQKKRPSWAFF